MDHLQALRDQLVHLLDGRGARATFDEAVADMRLTLRGVRPPGAPHSAWELLEHLRIAQWDMLEFSRNPDYVSPPWPSGYWPTSVEPPDPLAWDASVDRFRADLAEMQHLVADPKSDLFRVIPHGTGQTLLREALQLADHNSYHIGELVLLRRMMGAWPQTPAVAAQ